jgi:hypothetical protein
MDQQAEAAKKRWDLTVEASLGRLGKQRHDVKLDLDYATFDLYLRNLLAQTNSSGLAILVSTSEPVVALLQQFTTAIGAISQTNSTVAFVWGSVQALLEVREPFTVSPQTTYSFACLQLLY